MQQAPEHLKGPHSHSSQTCKFNDHAKCHASMYGEVTTTLACVLVVYKLP